jgi:dTDP-4-amino-4,6-dideoxygalactose transaminase
MQRTWDVAYHSSTLAAENTGQRLKHLESAILLAVRDIIETGVLVQGPRVAALEAAIKQNWHVSGGVVATNAGTTSLQMALMASLIGPGDEVIVPAFTFVSTAFAVSALGATPVFVDSDEYYTIDPRAVEAALTPRTAAIIPVHLYGHMAAMEPLLALAEQRELILIEDAAQAHGATWRQHYAGTLGDFGCFSLYSGKNMGGLGDGGMVVCRDEHMSMPLQRLRDLGRRPGHRYEHEAMGLRARMSEIDAAVSLLQLQHLEAWNAVRRRHAEHYGSALADLPCLLPRVRPDSTPVFYKYTIRLETSQQRDALARFLKQKGIETDIIYPTLVPHQPAYEHLPHRIAGSLTQAEASVKTILSLPLSPEMTSNEIERVAAAVRAFYHHAAKVI